MLHQFRRFVNISLILGFLGLLYFYFTLCDELTKSASEPVPTPQTTPHPMHFTPLRSQQKNSFRDAHINSSSPSWRFWSVLDGLERQDLPWFDPANDLYRWRQWLDFPGLRETDSKNWPLWRKFLERRRVMNTMRVQYWDRWPGKTPLTKPWHEEEDFANVTGTLSTGWVRYVKPLDGKINRTGHNTKADESRRMNILGNRGWVSLKFEEEKEMEMEFMEVEDYRDEKTKRKVHGVSVYETLVRKVTAIMTVQDEGASEDWELRLHGVHMARAGKIFMTTMSEKFAGIFAMPALWTGASKTGLQLLSDSVMKTLLGLEKTGDLDKKNPWAAIPDAEGGVQHCKYLLDIDLRPTHSPWWASNPHHRLLIEQSQSDGEFFVLSDLTQMAVVIYSPDCGFILESKN